MSKNNFATEFMEKDRLGSLLGARLISLDKYECRYEYHVTEEHFNPYGILHGGLLFSLMDSSQGMLVHSLLEEGAVAATGTATIKYLMPVKIGRIVICTRIIERQGRKIYVRSESMTSDSQVVAVLNETWVMLNQLN